MPLATHQKELVEDVLDSSLEACTWRCQAFMSMPVLIRTAFDSTFLFLCVHNCLFFLSRLKITQINMEGLKCMVTLEISVAANRYIGALS